MSQKVLLMVVAIALTGCHDGYQRVKGRWAYGVWNEGVGLSAQTLEVDEATFKRLRQKAYAKDKTSVFYEGDKVPNADPDSFEVLRDPQYARDQSKVYFVGNIIEGAHPKSFTVIKAPFSRDATKIYCGTVPMAVTELDQFKVLKVSGMRMGGRGFGWACDGTSIYYGSDVIEDADYESFKVIDEVNAVDKKRHYDGSEFWVKTIDLK